VLWFEIYEIWIFELCVGLRSGWGFVIQQEEYEDLDILAVDLSQKMVDEVRKRFPNQGLLGNVHGVRALCADGTAIPRIYQPLDAIFMVDSFRSMFSQREALLQASLMLKAGGKLIICHPQGRESDLAEDSLTMPHQLPTVDMLKDMTSDLPFWMLEAVDDDTGYIMVLQVAELYTIDGGARFMEGEVVTGFGRGSAKMGIPTANINPDEIAAQLVGMPNGVYFGWAKLQGEDAQAHKMVMNVGNRPTFVDGDGVSVEAHVMHKYNRDFHGERMRLVVTGYVRPEMKFASMDELVERIHTDVGLASSSLLNPMHKFYSHDEYLKAF